MNNPLEDSCNEYKKKSNILSFFVKFVISVALFLYLYTILFGEYSIGVLLDAKSKKKRLKKEYNILQDKNQKLQKKHFEMIQLTPQEDTF